VAEASPSSSVRRASSRRSNVENPSLIGYIL
jgi:hypothetical protein